MTSPRDARGPGGALQVSVHRGDITLTQVAPTDRPVQLGRSTRCDVVLNDPGVSRHHAVLTWEAGRPVLVDEGSRNGIWRDGRRVRRVALEAGVTVVLGPFRLTAAPVSVSAVRIGTAESTVVVAPKEVRPQPPDRGGRSGAGPR